ncbi:hypothetical protein D3C76_358790 [compost metagenome]
MITSLSQQIAASSGRAALGALVFAGPGLGIFLTGLLALGSNLMGQGSATLWLVYAAVALVMLLPILPILPAPAAASGPTDVRAGNTRGIARLGVIYALYGVGYIIPATFMSQMANARFAGLWQADLFWPCFGLMAAVGVVLASLRTPDPRTTPRWLAVALWLQAAGVFACLLPNAVGLALGVVLCGTPFLACMQLVMQRSRELAPQAAQRNAGLLTACFALGQLSGPLLAALSTQFSGNLQPALLLAGSGLLVAGFLPGRVLKLRAMCASDDATIALR